MISTATIAAFSTFSKAPVLKFPLYRHNGVMVRLQHAFAWLCLLLTLSAAAMAAPKLPTGGELGAAQTQREYAYALSLSSNVVTGYQIGAEGNLLPLQKDGLAIHGEAFDIATVPGNRAVFIVNKTRNQIDQFHIGPDGLLSPSAEAFIATGSNPMGINLNPSGPFAYVLNDSGISQYRVTKNGTLSALSPAIVDSDQRPRNLQFVSNKPICLLTPARVAPEMKRLVVIIARPPAL